MERSAGGSLRQLGSIQVTFRTSDSDANGINDYWVEDVAGLYFFQTLRMTPLSTALADKFPAQSYPGYAPAPIAGYWLRALSVEGTRSGRNPDHFAVCAYPVKYGGDTRVTFIMNEEGMFLKKDLGGRTISQWPGNPAAEGWVRVPW